MSDGCGAEDRGAEVIPHARLAWPRLSGLDRLGVILGLLVVASVAFPHLPPGACFSDPGDLQLASATLGVMHPPGYGGYATIGSVITHLSWGDPAYAVSLACLASGIVALGLCALVQIRLGVNPWIAVALVVALSGDARVWKNLVAPEVYMPSLAFLGGAVYLVIRYSRIGRRGDLLTAAALFGVVISNRPNASLMLPFFILGWWIARKRWELSPRRYGKTFAWMALCALVPCVYGLGYIWVRDTPETSYNYIEHHNAEFHYLPEATDGNGAKLERLVWLTSAKEFERYVSKSWRHVRMRLRWLYSQFALFRVADVGGMLLLLGPLTFFIAMAILLFGGALVQSRSRVSFVLLVGVAIGSLLFVCMYRIYGQAADLMPLLFCATIFGGVALSPLFPRHGSTPRRVAAGVVLILACAFTVIDAPGRRLRSNPDATAFLEAVDMATLPPRAVICSTWRESTALWYAKHVLTGRSDVDVINTTTHHWLERLEPMPDRPAFAVKQSSVLDGFTATPYRVTGEGDAQIVHLWRLKRSD